MERTESIVVQVAPDFENFKIKEMESFGWSLSNRQEIHEKGDAYGRPSYISNSTYVIKTTVNKYVKLHFVRNLGLANLDKVKSLESEYFNLPIPEFPSLVPFLYLIFWPLWPLWYLRGYRPKRAVAERTMADARKRQEQIRAELKALL